MKKIFALLLLIAFSPQAFSAVAPDIRISDADGHVANVNQDGSLAVSGSGGGSLNFLDDSTTTGNVTYVGCSDSIAAAVAAATSGDTLELGSCTYDVGAGLDVTKALNIVGQGPTKTILTSSTDLNQLIASTADGLRVSNLTLTGTNVGDAIYIDLTAGTGTSGVNNYFSNLVIDIVGDPDNSTTGITMEDTGGEISNVRIKIRKSSPTISTDQIRGINYVFRTTSNADIVGIVRNTFVDTGYTTGDTANMFCKGIFVYNYQDLSSNTATITLINTRALADSALADSNGLFTEGTGITLNDYAGFYDGNVGETNVKARDIFANINSAILLNGTIAARGRIANSNGATISRFGYFNGGAVNLTGASKPDDATGATATAGVDIISAISGATGGDTTIATTGTGGTGSDSVITLGNGGVANSANTASTGGKGGSFTYTAGTGGASSTATGTNVGGAGGDWNIVAGDGGASDDTGGAAGKINLTYGAAGSGGSPTAGFIKFAGQSEDATFSFPTTNTMLIDTTTGTVNYLLSNSANKTFGVEANDVADTAGKMLTIFAGDATTGSTDKAGGALVIQSGKGTGSGDTDITLKTFPGSAGSTSYNSIQTSLFIDGATNNIGIQGDTAPSWDLAFSAGAHDFGIDRRLSGSTAGGALTIQAGGSFATSTDVAGGILNLSSGIATGNAGSVVNILAVKSGQGTGTTDRSPTTVVSITPTTTSAGIAVTATDTAGFVVVDGTDNTTGASMCTSACMYGILNATGTAVTGIVNCDDATADAALCMGPS